MAAERKLSMAEVRRTIATSLGTAFGLIIALMWNTVVNSGLALAGLSTTTPATPTDWLIFVVTAVAVTVAMIVLIILFSRWGSK